MIVADTNLIAYLLLGGDGQAEADRVLQRDGHWIAPPLWRSEFRSVLLKHLRADFVGRREAARAWAEADALLTDSEIPVDTAEVLHLALDRRISSYDAEYVATARLHSVPLVTSDRRLIRVCPEVAVAPDSFAPPA